MNRLLVMLTLALLLGVLSFACSPSQVGEISRTGTNSGNPGTITIEDFAFRPAEIRVRAGDTVTWVNQDSAPHTVTGDGWQSGNMSLGGEFSRKFETAGSFDYTCAYHPGMKGRVVVE